MATERRLFLKQLGGLTLGTAVTPAFASLFPENNFPAIPNYSSNDEQFWKSIREQFPLKKSRVYLNNGTMGHHHILLLIPCRKG